MIIEKNHLFRDKLKNTLYTSCYFDPDKKIEIEVWEQVVDDEDYPFVYEDSSDCPIIPISELEDKLRDGSVVDLGLIGNSKFRFDSPEKRNFFDRSFGNNSSKVLVEDRTEEMELELSYYPIRTVGDFKKYADKYWELTR